MSAEIKRNMGAEYYRDSASPSNPEGWVSKSILWDCFGERSPYQWKFGLPKESSPAMAFGSMVHTLVFQPHRFPEEYAISEFESFRTNAAKDWKAEQEAAGKIVVSQEQAQKASEMEDVVTNEIALNGYDCDYEVAVYASSLKAKGLIDMVPKTGNYLLDLKTTSSIPDEKQLAGFILSRGYHWQAAMYLDLWNAASDEDRNKFLFLLVHTAVPYETTWVELSEKMIEQGRNEYKNALMRWQNCVSKNTWPKKTTGVVTVELPAWYNTTNQ